MIEIGDVIERWFRKMVLKDEKKIKLNIEKEVKKRLVFL